MAEKVDIWMPFYIADYLASTMHLSCEESGAYLHLLFHSWKSGTLPTNLEQLRRITRLDKERWQDVWLALRPFFKLTDDGFIQERLESEREEWAAKKKVNSRRAASAADSRWTKNAPSMPQAMLEECSTDAPSIAQASPKHAPSISSSIAQALLEECPSSSSSPSSLKAKTKAYAHQPRERLIPTPEELEMVYQAYPRQVGRARALQEVARAVARLGVGGAFPAMGIPEALAFLHERAGAYARAPAGQQGEYTPHPATWFHQERYFDDEQAWQRSGNGKDQQHRSSADQRRDDNRAAIIAANPNVFRAGADCAPAGMDDSLVPEPSGGRTCQVLDGGLGGHHSQARNRDVGGGFAPAQALQLVSARSA